MNPKRFLAAAHILPPFLAAMCLDACTAGDGVGLSVSGRPLEEGGDLPPAPTLESIQANVFDPFCIVCHSGAGAPQGLRLDAANSYVNLVGVPSQEVGSVLRVEPGNPDGSYLIRKLEGTATEGGRMPLGAPPLPQPTIDFIRQWIVDGAQPVAAAPPGSKPMVVSLTLTAASRNSGLPAMIIGGFDRDVDASTVNELTFVLRRSGGDGRFADGNEVTVEPAWVGLSPLNPRLAIMDLGGVAPVPDRYRATLKASGPNFILGVGGQALDEDFEAEFDVSGAQMPAAGVDPGTPM